MALEHIPTVYFDLSDGAGGQSDDPAPSRTDPSGRLFAGRACAEPAVGAKRSPAAPLGAPTVAEHYGALLRIEETSRREAEEQLRAALEELRCTQQQMRAACLEFEQEKAELSAIIQEKEDIIAFEQTQADLRVAEERETMWAEQSRLRERVKQLNLVQKSLQKQVSNLMAEREELKRLLERSAGSHQRRMLSTSSTGTLLAEGGSSSPALISASALSRAIPNETASSSKFAVSHLAPVRSVEEQSRESSVELVPGEAPPISPSAAAAHFKQCVNDLNSIAADGNPGQDSPGRAESSRERSSSRKLRSDSQPCLRPGLRRGPGSSGQLRQQRQPNQGQCSASTQELRRSRSFGHDRSRGYRSAQPPASLPRDHTGLAEGGHQACAPPSFAELMSLPLPLESSGTLSSRGLGRSDSAALAAAEQEEFLSSYVQHMRAYSRRSCAKLDAATEA